MEVLPLPQDDNLPVPTDASSQTTCECSKLLTIRNRTVELSDITNTLLRTMLLDKSNAQAYSEDTHTDETHSDYHDHNDHDQHNKYSDYDDHRDHGSR